MSWQDEEHDALLIDRAAAAEVPRDEAVREWARDKRAFISSIMEGLRKERAAAADGVRLLGARPVMFEEFGGRDADPQDAYLGKVETSQIYVGILGQRYGKPLPTRFSATHTEFRHAEKRGLRIAVWALNTQKREGPQESFLEEVRTFHGPVESAAPEGDALLIKLDPHLQALSVSFALPKLSSIPGQLDLFPDKSVSRESAVEQDAKLIVERSLRETEQQQKSA